MENKTGLLDFIKDLNIKNKQFPPNMDLVMASGFDLPNDAVLTYGDSIYNPSGKEITPDILKHESVHIEQQLSSGDPYAWCNRYLTDAEFRFESELEAYATQLKFCQEVMPTSSMVSWRLDQMASALSSDYQLDITFGEAKSKIRNKTKHLDS